MVQDAGSPGPPPRRARLSAEDRRRQLVGIGLAKLVEKPIQDLSIDEVAAEAGISRGLLFHYFPTKRDYYLACIAAAGRRILRTTAPDPDAAPAEQLRQTVGRYLAQVERRRDFYLSLAQGTGAADAAAREVYDGVRRGLEDRVLVCLALDEARRPLVHGWWAYAEARALVHAGVPEGPAAGAREALVTHLVAALDALLALPELPGLPGPAAVPAREGGGNG